MAELLTRTTAPPEGAARGKSVARTRRVITVVTAGLLFLLTMARRPAREFHYDATSYWAGSKAGWEVLLHGGWATKATLTPMAAGRAGPTGAATLDTMFEFPLRLRGVLTYLVYAPAALVDRVLPGAGAVAVLAENALILALAGAVLLPAIAWRLGARSPLVVCLCAALAWIAGAGFAPYPLMDLPAAAAFVCAVLFASARSRWAIALTGLFAGVALNIRPAYLLPLAALAAASVAVHRLRALWTLPGLTLALLPQFALNLVLNYGWLPAPPLTALLARYQAELGSYIVRYDTVLPGAPRLFYCDPLMASVSRGGPVRTLLAGLPWSPGFLAEKFSAALAWSGSTPYSAPAGVEDFGLLLPIAAVTVCGGTALVAAAVRARAGVPRGHAPTVVAAFLGAAATLVTTTTEARFALPVVLLGVAGCALLVPRALGGDARMGRGWWLAAGTVTALVVAFAVLGLRHPLSSEPTDPAACAALR
ncbi:hypothetical protein [Microbispora sp. NBC_01389]|uniref:hypothetical protein n=1 Tax=Microbispora sp. NBC_01389 TaxID=2903584 RepID=UPI003251E8AD